MGSVDRLMAPSWLNISTPVLGVTAVIVVILYGFRFYRRSLPRPIPGIPYNKGLGILGDLPEILAAKRKGVFRDWLSGLNKRHNSAIVQFFGPFGAPPIVVLTDYREAYDILLRRSREFDRVEFTGLVFSAVVPEHHISMQSADPRYKRNKELVRDLMTPAFLNDVSAPSIYEAGMHLTDLWRLKAEISGGRPFAGYQDLHEGAMDIILAVAFGFGKDRSISKLRMDSLVDMKTPATHSDDADEPFVFPDLQLPADLQAVANITEILGEALRSNMPLLRARLMRRLTRRKDFTNKDRFVRDEISKAVARLAEQGNDETATKCAMDHMILREIAAAKKADRQPVLYSQHMQDEILGYLIAGHDTSSTTMAWMLKYLSDDQRAQGKLRGQLRAAYSEAYAEKRQPKYTEINRITAPYLDAFLEESLRLTQTLPFTGRQSIVDTTLLGVPIPKNTMVFIHTRGPSFAEPAIPIPEDIRHPSCQATKERVGVWNDDTIGEFLPERWLKLKNHDGEQIAAPAEKTAEAGSEGEFDNLVYDANAGPFLTFSGGPRGCFGKRLAYMELRMVLALLVWNFEFQKCPDTLSGYEGVESLTTPPRQCFVKLKPLT